MGLRRSDDAERRKVALMRSAGTVTADTRTVSGAERKYGRRKPSMPKMPWDPKSDDVVAIPCDKPEPHDP